LPLQQLAFITACSKRIIKDRCPYQCYNGKYRRSQPIRNDTFSWRSNNMSHYKAFDHQHLGEINQSESITSWLYKRIDFLYRIEVILQEEFCNLIHTVEESLEDMVAKYEAFIKISLCNRYHY
jgi:N-acetyl-gamma-glutamyl-phosphate reductase